MQNRRPNLFTPKSDQPAKPTDKNNDNLEKINEFITSIETTISELKKDKLLSYPLQSNLQQMTVSQHIETYIKKNANWLKKYCDAVSLADDIRGLRERNLNTAGTTDTLTKWGEDYKKIIDALPTLIQKKIDEKEATLQYWQNAKKAYEQTPKVHKVY